MNKFKAMRLKKEYTQNQIAQFMHIGASTVFRWEQGISKPTLYQFLKLCSLLNCTPSELIGNISNEQIPVFTVGFDLVNTQSVTMETREKNCCFGIVVPHSLSPRITKGDICFFSFDSEPEKDSIVFSSADGYNGQLCIFKEYDENIQIIAVCQFLHSRI